MSTSVLEEKLRESACYGDIEAMVSLLKAGVNVNAANAMNGWTPLHWACKRSDIRCKETLLSWGADINICDKKGRTPLDVEIVKNKLDNVPDGTNPIRNKNQHQESATTMVEFGDCAANKIKDFVPNYRQHPSLNYKVDLSGLPPDTQIPNENRISGCVDDSLNLGHSNVPRECPTLSSSETPVMDTTRQNTTDSYTSTFQKDSFRILKVRMFKTNSNSSSISKPLADSRWNSIPTHVFALDNDFVEVDVAVRDLTMRGLIRVVFTELQIPSLISTALNEVYVRKLPNTRLRRDAEVARLIDYQEIEIGFLSDIAETINLNGKPTKTEAIKTKLIEENGH